jgi:hypothetical protein
VLRLCPLLPGLGRDGVRAAGFRFVGPVRHR